MASIRSINKSPLLPALTELLVVISALATWSVILAQASSTEKCLEDFRSIRDTHYHMNMLPPGKFCPGSQQNEARRDAADAYEKEVIDQIVSVVWNHCKPAISAIMEQLETDYAAILEEHHDEDDTRRGESSGAPKSYGNKGEQQRQIVDHQLDTPDYPFCRLMTFKGAQKYLDHIESVLKDDSWAERIAEGFIVSPTLRKLLDDFERAPRLLDAALLSVQKFSHGVHPVEARNDQSDYDVVKLVIGSSSEPNEATKMMTSEYAKRVQGANGLLAAINSVEEVYEPELEFELADSVEWELMPNCEMYVEYLQPIFQQDTSDYTSSDPALNGRKLVDEIMEKRRHNKEVSKLINGAYDYLYCFLLINTRSAKEMVEEIRNYNEILHANEPPASEASVIY